MSQGAAYAKVMPDWDTNRMVRLDEDLVRATTLEEWDNSKQSFLRPNVFEKDHSPLDDNLLVKRSKTEQSDPAINSIERQKREDAKDFK